MLNVLGWMYLDKIIAPMVKTLSSNIKDSQHALEIFRGFNFPGKKKTYFHWGYYNTYVSCFSLHFFRALAASCVLYNRKEHSQGFSIC